MAKNKNRPGERAEPIRQQIARWLMGEGFRVTEASSPDAPWALVAESGAPPDVRRVAIAQPNAHPQLLVVQLHLAAPRDMQAKLMAMDSAEREQIFLDMKLRLLALGVDFSNLGPPLDDLRLKCILYPEDLTRTALMDAVRKVQYAMLTIVWMTVQGTGISIEDPQDFGVTN